MKKRLLAGIAAIAMSCTMMSSWANTLTIDSIEVLDNENQVIGTYEAGDSIAFTTADRLKVNVTLSTEDETPVATAGETTFISYTGDGTTLDNTTIQYVAQESAGAEGETLGKASFIFRPRTTPSTGQFTAKVGGTEVDAAPTFSYTVNAAKKNMTLNGTDVAVDLTNETDDAVLTLTGFDGDTAALVVKSNSVALTGGQYTIAGEAGSYTITIPKATFATVGTYSITVENADYNAVTPVNVTVTQSAVEIPPVEEGTEDEVQDAINDIVPDAVGNVITLPDTVGEADNAVRYDVTVANQDANSAVTHDPAAKKITYDKENATKFAEKVTIVAKTGTDAQDISSTTHVYFIKDKISFGNVTAVVAMDGISDVFASDANLDAALADANKKNELLAARAEALKVILDNTKANTIADYTQTLDLKKDGKLELAEYRILKLMLDNNNDNFTVEKVQEYIAGQQ